MSHSSVFIALRQSVQEVLADSDHLLDRVILLALILMAVTLYRSSVGYPFFWDDPVELARAEARSVTDLFTSSRGYLYYRPLAFIFWKVLGVLRGRFDPLVFHGVQVLTHAINGCLVYVLTRRLTQRRAASTATAVLFVAYPFSYQAVTWVAVAQVQMTALALTAFIAFVDGRRRDDRRLLWVSLSMLTLALFVHESGVALSLVVVVLDVMARRSRDNDPGRRLSLRSILSDGWPFPILHVVVAAAFVVLWALVPKDPSTVDLRFEASVAGYLLQGLAWPVAGALGPGRTWLWGRPSILVTVATLMILGWMVLAHRHGGRLPLLWLSIVWFAVPLIPVWVTRGFGYVRIAPRLLYVSSVGAALAWGGLLELRIRLPWECSQGKAFGWPTAVAGLVCIVLWYSLVFIGVRKRVYAGVMPAIWDVVAWGREASEEDVLLFINAPDRATSPRLEFPLGDSVVMAMPVAVDIGDYMALHGGARPRTESLSVPRMAHLDRYPYEVSMRGVMASQQALAEAIRSADAVFFTEYHPSGRVAVVRAGNVTDAPIASTSLVRFGDILELQDVKLGPSGALTLHWICLGSGKPSDTIFVHVASSNHGPPDAQADGDPLHGLFPLESCQPGEHIQEVRQLPLQDLEKDAYDILVGAYNRASGRRLPAWDASGDRIPQDSFTVETWERK